MLDPNFVLLGALVNLVGISHYLIDTVKGVTKPNRITWLLWFCIPMVAFFAELGQGVGLISIMTFVIGLGPLLIFLASFADRKSYWQLGKVDIVCGALAATAIIAWILTGTGNLAIVLSIAAHVVATFPTLRKSYVHPDSESYQAYLAGIASTSITLLTIHQWTFAHYAFPFYILLQSTSLFMLVKRPRFVTYSIAKLTP